MRGRLIGVLVLVAVLVGSKYVFGLSWGGAIGLFVIGSAVILVEMAFFPSEEEE